MIIRFFIIFLLLINPSIANITDELLKLSKLYKEGLLTENEFKKAKSILLEIEEISKEQIILKSKPKNKEQKKIKEITKKKEKKSTIQNNIKIEFCNRKLKFGPFVYRLGHVVFILERGVRFP